MYKLPIKKPKLSAFTHNRKRKIERLEKGRKVSWVTTKHAFSWRFGKPYKSRQVLQHIAGIILIETFSVESIFWYRQNIKYIYIILNIILFWLTECSSIARKVLIPYNQIHNSYIIISLHYIKLYWKDPAVFARAEQGFFFSTQPLELNEDDRKI